MIFLVLWGKMIFFFFSKIWSYTLDGKWKMIFLKKYTEIWYFLQAPEKVVFPNRTSPAHDLSCVIWKDGIFFPKNMIFFPWAESERRSFLGNTWKHDSSPSEEKQETWYIGPKFGLSLNLFGWRYSTMNNPQCFVPFSPQELCLKACLCASKGNHLSIRG